MKAPWWIRRMFGASPVQVRGSQRPRERDARDERVDAAIAKANRAIDHRMRIDAEVDRVERFLREHR